jgi:hypothetical protein
MYERHVCDKKVTEDICGGSFLFKRDLQLKIGKLLFYLRKWLPFAIKMNENFLLLWASYITSYVT